MEAPNLEIEDLPIPFDWTENLTSKSIFIQNMDGIKDDHLLEDFVKRQIEKSDEIQAILTKPSLAQVSSQPKRPYHMAQRSTDMGSVINKIKTSISNTGEPLISDMISDSYAVSIDLRYELNLWSIDYNYRLKFNTDMLPFRMM